MKYLYLHFPFCRHLCNYCDFYKKIPQSPAELESFHEYLTKSWIKLEELAVTHQETFSSLESLYIGGGTPSLWGEEGATFLQRFLTDRAIARQNDCEWTLEVNPGSWTKEGLKAWRSVGVNRYSLGIQALDQRFLKILDRVHSLDEVYETLTYFGEENLNFSVDFMLGLPNSKLWERSIEKELREILKFNPKHISLYILTVPAHYRHFNELPDEEWIENEYLLVANLLKQEGFEHYEVSNFAKPGFESRHNLAYWRNETVAALGPSATGYFANAGFRYKWVTTRPDYSPEQLTQAEQELEKTYMRLRTSLGLNLRESFPNQSEVKLRQLVDQWVGKDLVVESSEMVVKPTSKGFLLLDSLMNDLFLLG